MRFRARDLQARRLVPWLLLAGLLVATSLLQASQVRPVNLEEMTERAATIFAGRCIESSASVDPDLGRVVTLATFEVDRAVKGELGDTVTVKLLGGGPEGGGAETSIAGLPGFRPGEEVVLFLYGESRLGLSSPVGLGQGKFTVFEDKQGGRIAVNAFGNAHLTRGLSQEAQRLLAPTMTGWNEPGELDPKTLLDMVEALGR
jgi:hypothetical protein